MAGQTVRQQLKGQGVANVDEAYQLRNKTVRLLGDDILIGRRVVMFTGIIEEIGHVNNVKKERRRQFLQYRQKKVLEGTHIGDSIAVNGVCLTVTGIYDNTFTADVMHETLNRSSLGKLVSGSAVNLERAMAADGSVRRTYSFRTY